MRGIDISNWQGGLSLHNVDVDFAIMKATEGTGFVDGYCDNWVNEAKEKGIKWGFYHFANNNDPSIEADFFIDNTINYFGEGIPILDIEDNSIPSWGQYADTFSKRVHERTGVWPLIYCSASHLWMFSDYDVWRNCGLWIAGYPYPASWWTEDDCPYGMEPWSCACIWQFTNSLRLDGYDGNLDGNISYIDAATWDKYANPNGDYTPPEPSPQPQPSKSIDDLAFEVILGEWGNGDDRVNMLSNAGYDYNMVQDRVNEIYNVAESVIRGEWGNGDERYNRLTNSGYNYDCVQHVVNTMLM